jgi:four helix bundle protein
MKTNNPLLEKSFDFGVEVSELAKIIRDRHKEYDLSRQLSRSSTYIGANAEEAIGAESIKDFYHKLSIAYKEARESHYFIRIIGTRKLINETDKLIYLNKAEELMKIWVYSTNFKKKIQTLKKDRHS